jgi:hypothetical protein
MRAICRVSPPSQVRCSVSRYGDPDRVGGRRQLGSSVPAGWCLGAELRRARAVDVSAVSVEPELEMDWTVLSSLSEGLGALTAGGSVATPIAGSTARSDLNGDESGAPLDGWLT